jgi:RNase P subunit RPR2
MKSLINYCQIRTQSLLKGVNMSGRRRSKDQKRRKTRSLDAISVLSDIVLSPEKNSFRVRDIAARDMLRMSKRHGQSNTNNSRILICRTCESLMRFGYDSHVRIRAKSVIITCERCDNKIRRPI